jgi:hypothetical protein
MAFAFSFYILLKLPDKESFDALSVDEQNKYSNCYIGYLSLLNNNDTNAAMNFQQMDPSLQAWQSPWLAILKTIMMMMGEYDYVNTFTSKAYDSNILTVHFDIMTYIMLCIFILIMPILLINLLIGLAVGDIESVRRNAELKRIAMQVQWLGDVEPKFPESIRKHLYKEVVTIYGTSLCDKAVLDSVTKAFKEREVALYGTPADSRAVAQERKVQSIQKELSRQTDLLRLIVQKMEIEAEADEKDEGADDFKVECSARSSNPHWGKLRTTSKVLTKMKSLTHVDT